MKHEYPVTGVQSTVLQALGLTAENTVEAKELLESLGLNVTPVRQGRTSVPSITLMDGMVGGWSPEGDADYIGVDFRKVDLTPVLAWIVEKDQAAAQKRIARAVAVANPAAVTSSLDAALQVNGCAEQIVNGYKIVINERDTDDVSIAVTTLTTHAPANSSGLPHIQENYTSVADALASLRQFNIDPDAWVDGWEG